MANLFTTQKHNAIAVPSLLLKALGIKYNQHSLQQLLEDHPHFPSILAISDVLTAWGIPNKTYHIAKDDFNNENLLFPLIAATNTNGGSFVVVKKIENGLVYTGTENNDFEPLTLESFLHIFRCVALNAEPTATSGEPNYGQNRFIAVLNALLAPTALLALLIVMYLAIDKQGFSWAVFTLSLLKLCGVGISILLLMQSLNANNPFIKNLCTLNGKNDCNAILKSDAAKVTSWLSWSEVGFFYFTGSLLSLLFAPSSFSLLAWLNLFALPYTIYSIAYQYRNKNWCILCCGVQVLLVLEAISFLSANTYKLTYFPTYGLLTVLSFLMPMLTWSFLKPFFTKASQTKSLKSQLKKFKYNTELFNHALKSQPRYLVPHDLMPVILGNPNAKTIITIVSNPFCGPCAKAHELLDAWLKTRDNIQLEIIFTTASHDDDEKTKLSKHVSALSLSNDTKLLENALNDWYKQDDKKYTEWAKKYPVKFIGEMSGITDKQKVWCELSEITTTPTILVNGYKLPDPYQLNDIKHLVD